MTIPIDSKHAVLTQFGTDYTDRETIGHVLASVVLSESEPPKAHRDMTEEEAVDLTETIRGRGKQVSKLFTLQKGLAIFRMTHSGNRNFIIWLLDDNGKNVELLVNEQGSFDGSKAVGIDKTGKYILDIKGDGNWTITVEQ